MRFLIYAAEITVILTGASGLFYKIKKNRQKGTLVARFVGGPLDGEKRYLRRYTDTYTELVDDEWAQYTHDDLGIYEYEDSFPDA